MKNLTLLQEILKNKRRIGICPDPEEEAEEAAEAAEDSAAEDLAAEDLAAEVVVALEDPEDPEDREASEDREALEVPPVIIVADGFSDLVFTVEAEDAWEVL